MEKWELLPHNIETSDEVILNAINERLQWLKDEQDKIYKRIISLEYAKEWSREADQRIEALEVSDRKAKFDCESFIPKIWERLTALENVEPKIDSQKRDAGGNIIREEQSNKCHDAVGGLQIKDAEIERLNAMTNAQANAIMSYVDQIAKLRDENERLNLEIEKEFIDHCARLHEDKRRLFKMLEKVIDPMPLKTSVEEAEALLREMKGEISHD